MTHGKLLYLLIIIQYFILWLVCLGLGIYYILQFMVSCFNLAVLVFSRCSFELACTFVWFCFLDHFLIFWHHSMCSLFWPCNQIFLQRMLVPWVINQCLDTEMGKKIWSRICISKVVGMHVLWISHFTPCDMNVLEKHERLGETLCLCADGVTYSFKSTKLKIMLIRKKAWRVLRLLCLSENKRATLSACQHG